MSVYLRSGWVERLGDHRFGMAAGSGTFFAGNMAGPGAPVKGAGLRLGARARGAGRGSPADAGMTLALSIQVSDGVRSFAGLRRRDTG